MKSIKLIFALWTTCYLCACTHESEIKFTPAPSILESGKDLILITVDTLRADRLPFYGGARQNAGDVDQQFSLAWLANNGTLLEQMYAHVGVTLPSIASLWTGLEPLEHGVLTNQGLLTDATYAMQLADAGWTAFAYNTNGVLREGTGLERGFESYTSIKGVFERRVAKELSEQAKTAIQNKKPLLLWAHYLTPHAPYAPPKEFAQTYASSLTPAGTHKTIYELELSATPQPELVAHLKALYDEELLATNFYVQDLLTRLDQMYRDSGRGDLLSNAIVVFTSDHGEELADRNNFFRHSKSLYSGVTHVPAIICGEGWDTKRESQIIGLSELLPWVIDGKSPQGRPVVSALKNKFFSIRDDHWTLVHNPRDDNSSPGGIPEGALFPYPTLALFARDSDPLEMDDVASLYPEIAEGLLDELSAWFHELNISGENFNEVIDNQTLSELGYASDEDEDQGEEIPPPWSAEQWQARRPR